VSHFKTNVDRSGNVTPGRRCLRFLPSVDGLERRALFDGGGAFSAADVASASPGTGSNPVLTWDAIALKAIRVDRTPPPVAARNLAVLHVAIDDAAHVRRSGRAPLGARGSPDAAVAAAADLVLDRLYPAQATTFDVAFARSLAVIPDGSFENRGVATGRAAANAVLADRSQDGSNATFAYTPGTAPGQWRPTPPGSAAALLPHWPNVTPFALRRGDQFRPAGPPPLSSRVYAAALSEVERLGRIDSAARTPDQTQIALFWADNAGTATPPGHWNQIAAAVAASRHLGTARAARLFAVLDTALADAGIAAWDSKYVDNFWRPVTAIGAADTDGNPRTGADPAWTPLLATPPFPSYVSGHSTFSAAAAEVLSAFFGPDTRFRIGSDALPGVTRTFRSFDQAAAEAGISRIYGGIHFGFDNRDGLILGRAVGRAALLRYGARPIAMPDR